MSLFACTPLPPMSLFVINFGCFQLFDRSTVLINHQFSLFFNQHACLDWVSHHKNQIDCKRRLSMCDLFVTTFKVKRKSVFTEINNRWFDITWKTMDKCTSQYNSRSFLCFTLPENTDFIFLVAISWGYTINWRAWEMPMQMWKELI